MDDDVVDESNLQRQILHTADRVGMPKTQSAQLTLNALNPATKVVEHREWLSAENVERLIADYDVVVDGTDNFDTRYVLNDAAVKLRKPVVHGSIYRWDGQVTTFVPFAGPCYRCMYPIQPPPELAPACSVAGVLGVLPGIAGVLQANEVFKLLLGVGETLAGRLLMFDAMGTTFEEVKVWRDPALPGLRRGIAMPRRRRCRAAHRRGRMSSVRIPPVLRDAVGGAAACRPAARTVREVLADLFVSHPGLRDRVTEDGELCRFVNVYVNDRDVRYREGMATPVEMGHGDSAARHGGRRAIGVMPATRAPGTAVPAAARDIVASIGNTPMVELRPPRAASRRPAVREA